MSRTQKTSHLQMYQNFIHSPGKRWTCKTKFAHIALISTFRVQALLVNLVVEITNLKFEQIKADARWSGFMKLSIRYHNANWFTSGRDCRSSAERLLQQVPKVPAKPAKGQKTNFFQKFSGSIIKPLWQFATGFNVYLQSPLKAKGAREALNPLLNLDFQSKLNKLT